MRVWRLVVCKLCSGQPFSHHFLIYLISSLTSSNITHLSPPCHTTHLIHLTQHLTYIHISHYSSHSSHITSHIHIHLSSHFLIFHHWSLTTHLSPPYTTHLLFISRHSFHTIHLTPLISNHSSHTTHLTLLKHRKLNIWGYPLLLFFFFFFFVFVLVLLFPECIARDPVSFGGLGVRLCSRKVASVSPTVRNRLRDRRNRLRECDKLSTVASASGAVLKACEVDSLSSQLYWHLQGNYLCEWSVSPQLYWCLYKRCLCEWSVSRQLFWFLQRKCLYEWSVLP